jgi:hypothetical protein
MYAKSNEKREPSPMVQLIATTRRVTMNKVIYEGKWKPVQGQEGDTHD